jgi:hypothetical protein
MQQPNEMQKPENEKEVTTKPRNKTRLYLEKMDAKHKHHFQARNIFIGVTVACVIVFLVEIAILGFP